MLQLWFFANSILWPFKIELVGFKLGLNVIVLAICGAIMLARKTTVVRYTARIIPFILIYLVFSYLVAITGTCDDKLKKFIFTAPVLLVLILLGSEIGRRATQRDWLMLRNTAMLVILVAFVGFCFEALLPRFFPLQAVYRSAGKLSGWFHEPSHVAFSLFPSILILLTSGHKRFYGIGVSAIVGLLAFSRSSTLIGLVALWILYRIFVQRKLGRVIYVGLLFVGVIGFAAIKNYDQLVAPTLERIGGVLAVSETKNISSLVYVQGWQDAWANLRRTNGMGLGFNMMGCHPLPDDSARSILSKTSHGELNADDGSFVFSKIVSEAGIVGILFFAVIIWWWLRLEKYIRKCQIIDVQRTIANQSALMFSFIATSLVRSSGYFDGGLLLLTVGIAGAAKWYNLKNYKLSRIERVENGVGRNAHQA